MKAGGALLVAAYTLLAVAAGARALVQLSTRFAEAPLPYSLSGVSAAVYLVAAIALRRQHGLWTRVAAGALVAELVGVVAVGTVSVLCPEEFPDQTVWSGYGVGYGFLPLLLPVLGLAWLRRRTSEVRSSTAEMVGS